MKSSSASPCPVPEEQRPINEYRTLADSWFFRWGALSRWDYLKPLVLLWWGSWIVAGPVSAASWAPAKHPIEFVGWAVAGACVPALLSIVRLYLGWTYIYQRLFSTKVLYEESGWYDGQTWEKNPEMLDQDRLVALYEIQPLVRRMQVTIGALVGLGIVGVVGAVGWQAGH
jgi:Conserved in the green lineage and diatoms 27